MTETQASGSNVVPLRSPDPGRQPYFTWLDRVFPTGDLSWNPPLAEFLASPDMRNAWTSRPAPGSEPADLRIDLYLRRRWRTDERALCLGNCGVAGEQAPRGWTAPTLALLSDSLDELETLARKAGYARIAVEHPTEDVRMACVDRGYRLATDSADEHDLVKELA